MNKTLDMLLPGQDGIVVAVRAKGAIKRRLFDMGITPGTRIFMRKAAPLGDPIEINLRGFSLSIRKADASCIVLRGEQ